ncbi:MAG: indolepyruvate ferredoxin oxidoreductase subunit alpha, partial [Clostridia bacterium]|nr:indolepyruvate ferredoxin oxidoreductase subunit alpha [Clostridia bacterium]
IKGDPTVAVNLEALARAVGFNNVVVVDPFDIEGTKAAVKAELEKKEPSLIISRRPCALLKTVKHSAPVKVDADKCIGCKACLNVGCQALSQTKRENGKYLAVIDNTQGVGCGVCASAGKFVAIEKGGKD